MHLSRQRAVRRLARRRATPVSVLASNLSTLLGPPAQPPRDRPSGLRLATRQDVRVGINFNQVPQPKKKWACGVTKSETPLVLLLLYSRSIGRKFVIQYAGAPLVSGI